jgi:hypothetical protein
MHAQLQQSPPRACSAFTSLAQQSARCSVTCVRTLARSLRFESRPDWNLAQIRLELASDDSWVRDRLRDVRRRAHRGGDGALQHARGEGGDRGGGVAGDAAVDETAHPVQLLAHSDAWLLLKDHQGQPVLVDLPGEGLIPIPLRLDDRLERLRECESARDSNSNSNRKERRKTKRDKGLVSLNETASERIEVALEDYDLGGAGVGCVHTRS